MNMQNIPSRDWFELCLDKYPDLPSLVLIRSLELKFFPRQFLVPPVLDLCCGDGFFTECLGLKSAYGCDLDEKAIEQARRLEKTYSNVWKSDARDLKIIKDAQFNSVFANCALEHVDGVGRALKSIARVLKAGGRLIMTVPGENLNNWFFPRVMFSRLGLAEYGRRLCKEYNKKQQHINICSLDFWSRKLEDSGLTVENHFYSFRKNEYRLVTFFESFVLESFPGNLFQAIDRLFRKGIPLDVRKSFWRKVLKKIYLNAEALHTGGELFIVARKKQHTV